MYTISAVIIFCAEPFTRIFYSDPSEPVFMMTAWKFRIFSLCMPLSIIAMHFNCYAQTSGKRILLLLPDGVLRAAGFTAPLIRRTGMNS